MTRIGGKHRKPLLHTTVSTLAAAGLVLGGAVAPATAGSAAESPGSGTISVPGAGARNAGWRGAPAGLAWLSGASGDPTITGEFATWRNNQVQIAGTWSDISVDEMLNMWSICPLGDNPALNYVDWNRPLDVAVLLIDKEAGDSWAEAAKGTYLDRWSKNMDRIKECWGTRDPAMLYLRPTHEMNYDGTTWSVAKGEEADYVKALTMYSRLRYDRLPTAKIVFCPNDDTSQGMADPRDYWPGDHKDDPATHDDDRYVGLPVANVYGLDSYNKWMHQTVPAAVRAERIIPYFEKTRQLAESLGAPFAIGEWGNSAEDDDGGGGGESPAYVREMYKWAAAHGGDPRNPRPGQLLYEIYFNQWRKYQLTDPTIQPLTAEAYRQLPWGVTWGHVPPGPGPRPTPLLRTKVLAQGECYGTAGWSSRPGIGSYSQFVPDRGSRCDLNASALVLRVGPKEIRSPFAGATRCHQATAGPAPCLFDRTPSAGQKVTFEYVLCPAVGADKVSCRTFSVEDPARPA